MTQPSSSALKPNDSSKNGSASQPDKKRRVALLITILSIITGVLVAQFQSVHLASVAALTVLCIGMWATVVVPEYWTALAFFLIAIVADLAPASAVLSGFQSSTFWLLFAGLVLGASFKHTGLGKRIAKILAAALGNQYSTMIWRIVAFGIALSFIMPSSMGRIALLLPIMMALTDKMGYAADSKGRIGIITATAFGTWLPAFTILPANAPNMILAGMTENLLDIQLSYWDYLIIHFPVLGALKGVVLVWLILKIFPSDDPKHIQQEQVEREPVSGNEKLLAAIIFGCLAFWLTDSIHHISPGWIGLAGAILCLCPFFNLTAKNSFQADLNYNSLFFVAGIIGLGAVISQSGLGETLIQSLGESVSFSPDEQLKSVVSLTFISSVVAITTSLPGVPAVMTPIAGDLATSTGLPVMTVLMTQVFAYSNILLPYQAPPIVTAMQMGKLPVSSISKLCVSLFVITLVLLLPLDLLWWQVIGLL